MPTSCASFARSLIRRWICSSTESMRARTASSFAVLGGLLRAAMAARSDEPRREDARDGADPAEEILADGAVDIDERVGVFAARLVEQIRDVDPGFRQAGRDLSHHVGHVAVGYA